MRGKWILFAGITLLVAVAAGALSVYLQSLPKSSSESRPAAPAAVEAPVNEISLRGIVQAQQVINVPSPIEGTVESFGAEVGDDVFEGQMIAHIRNDRLDLGLESATSELRQGEERVNTVEAAIIAARLEESRARADASRAKSEFERAEKVFQRQQMLMREGATPRLVFEKSQREFEEAKQDLELKETLARNAEERVESLNRDLEFAKKRLQERTLVLEDVQTDVAAGDVRSPVDGIVISRRGAPGEDVNRTMEDLFLIATAISALEIAVQPEPAVLPRIEVGQPASVHVAEMPNEAIPGTVREIKEGRVIVDFTSPTPAIRPGVTAQVYIKLK
jgi:HlyD family secretion protein